MSLASLYSPFYWDFYASLRLVKKSSETFLKALVRAWFLDQTEAFKDLSELRPTVGLSKLDDAHSKSFQKLLESQFPKKNSAEVAFKILREI